MNYVYGRTKLVKLKSVFSSRFTKMSSSTELLLLFIWVLRDHIDYVYEGKT